MADRDMKEDVTPFELKIAEAMGLTPEEVHLAIKFGTKPEDIMAVKQTGWRKKSERISEEQE